MTADAADVPEDVRRQALYPFSELPLPATAKHIPIGGAVQSIIPHPNPQIAFPTTLGFDVASAVEQSRAVAREHGKTIVAWWLGPEYDELAPEFEALGIVNKDAPGFEATENAMVLLSEPAGERPTDVDVHPVESFEEFLGAAAVGQANFGLPPEPEETMRKHYEEYLGERTGESFVAVVDGKVVAGAYAAFGNSGLNLFGGAVLEEMRGRGIYRALMFARWDRAVERGTPALTVQAGKMSMPICERLGFRYVGRARIFVDELT